MQLIVCDSIDEFNIIKQKWGKSIETGFLIFTTNSQFYFLHKNMYTMELFESKYITMVEETTEVLRYVNEFLRKIVRKRNYLYEVGYHIEGGGIEQDMADVLNTTRVCMDFFTRYNFKRIYLCCNKKNALIVEVFRELAKWYQLKIKVCSVPATSIDECKHKIESSSGKGIKCLKYIWYMGKGICIYLKLLLMVIVNFQNRFASVQYWDVGKIQLSDAAKHFFWSIDFIKILNKSLTLNNICVHTDEMKERLKKEGMITTDFGKSYIHLLYFCVAVSGYYYNVVRIWYKLKKVRFMKEGADISGIVRHRVWQHILLTVPKAVELDCKAKGYFEKNKFKVIESWLGSNTVCTRIFYYQTRKENTAFYRIHNNGQAPFRRPLLYECEPEMIQIRFFTELERQGEYEWYRKMGWKGQAFLLEGTILPSAEEKQPNPNRVENEKCCILWAPSYPLMGEYMAGAFVKCNEIIIEECAKLDIHLLVKYHWNQEEEMIKKIKEKYRNKANVDFIDRKQPIEEYIEKADIVITTLSTVIFDTIFANRPVVIISEGHMIALNEKLNLQGYSDVEEAVVFIKKLIQDKSMRETVRIKQKESVEAFKRKCKRNVCGEIAGELKKITH